MRIAGLDHLTVTVPAASDLGHPVRRSTEPLHPGCRLGRWCGIAFAIDFPLAAERSALEGEADD